MIKYRGNENMTKAELRKKLTDHLMVSVDGKVYDIFNSMCENGCMFRRMGSNLEYTYSYDYLVKWINNTQKEIKWI